MKKSTTIQALVTIVTAAIAYLLPEFQTGDNVLDALISFAAFAPLVIVLSSLINTWLHWQSLKAFVVTGIVSVLLGYASFIADIGFLGSSTSLWWHPAITGLGMFASAVLGFNYMHLKIVLEYIFDYSFKKNVQL
jgi:hypothetical protein